MYENYYGFTAKPFQIVPNPDFLYLSPRYENALTYLEYGLMERVGFILLTGEVGSGKTTLVKHLLRHIESQFEVAVVFNTNVSPAELINMILTEFEINAGNSGKSSALDLLNQHLIGCYARNRRPLLIIDEAQNLSRESLEEIRMLSNLQTDDQTLLQIVLVGQPEIRDRLKAKDMVQLNQRISVAYHIPALTRDETGTYIAYRLEKAGCPRDDLFTLEAIDLIHAASNGIPRTINILCDSALVYGFADDARTIDVPLVEQVISDRDGMGLGACRQESAPSEPPARAGEADGSFMGWIEILEHRIQSLQSLLEGRMTALEGRTDGYRNGLVQEMKDLYATERKKSDKLIFEYARLKEKYQTLLPELAHAGIPGDQGALVDSLRESLACAQRENMRLRERYNDLRESCEDVGESVPPDLAPLKIRF